MESVSLFELNEFIRRVMALNFPEAVWLRAEIAQISQARGHFFIDLVEKENEGKDIIAQAAASLWSRQHKILSKKYPDSIETLLSEGMEVLLRVKVDFHERYGLKLIVEDIDPAYTIGKLALQKQEILRQLEKLDLIEKNRQIPLPPVFQKIAVLTSERAAGFQDFREHLSENNFGYAFQIAVFQTAVQGQYVESELTAQLHAIAAKQKQFDCAVIIRGGGARLDLTAFDNLEIAKAIAHFPLPVFTGIGHDVDETVADMVAAKSLKTPTAVADFLIQHNLQFESTLASHKEIISKIAARKIHDGELDLENRKNKIGFSAKEQWKNNSRMLDYIAQELPGLSGKLVKNNLKNLEMAERSVQFLSPEATLRRGYSLTSKNGEILKKDDSISAGDIIETILSAGKISSKVI